MLKQVEIPFNVQKSQGKLVSENMRSSATTKQCGLVSSVDYNLKQSLFDYYNNIIKCMCFRIFVWVDLVLWYFSQSEDALSITDYGFGSLPKQEHTIW